VGGKLIKIDKFWKDINQISNFMAFHVKRILENWSKISINFKLLFFCKKEKKKGRLSLEAE